MSLIDLLYIVNMTSVQCFADHAIESFISESTVMDLWFI